MMSREACRARWQDRIAAQQASGMSVVAWCRQQGIKRTRFYDWRQRLQAADPSPAAPQWVPVTLEPAAAPLATASGITLQVGAVTILVAPGFQPAVLRAVLATLEAGC